MSSANWQKQWLYDSHVVIPKTTKWRRSNGNVQSCQISDTSDHSDGWHASRNVTSEICMDYNVSPVKRQKIKEDDWVLQLDDSSNSNNTVYATVNTNKIAGENVDVTDHVSDSDVRFCLLKEDIAYDPFYINSASEGKFILTCPLPVPLRTRCNGRRVNASLEGPRSRNRTSP